MKYLILVLLFATSAHAEDSASFGDEVYERLGMIKNHEMEVPDQCPGFEEFVKATGHCPAKAKEDDSFGDEFYKRTGQISRE